MRRLDQNTFEAILHDLPARLIELSISPSKLIFDPTYRYSFIEHSETLPRKGISK